MRAAIQGYLFLGATSVPPTILDDFLTPHLQTELEGEEVGEEGVEGDEGDEGDDVLDMTGGIVFVAIESQG